MSEGMTEGQEQRLPPTPRLQQFPANDIYQFRLGERELISAGEEILSRA